jgi:hypothetical protein
MVPGMNTNQNSPQAFSQREPYVTKQHVAAFYHFTPRWVELRVAEGMPCHRFGGRVRFLMSEVDAWLMSAAAA